MPSLNTGDFGTCKEVNVLEFIMKPTKVINREGREVPIDITKIRAVITKACNGLSVDPMELELDSQIHFTDRISTKTIQETLIKVANEKVSIKYPDWTFVAARLLLHHLYKESSLQRGSPYGNFRSLVSKLVDEGRYDGRVLNEYTEMDFDMFEKAIIPERDLLLSYPGLKHLIDRYSIHSKDGKWFELPQDTFMGVSIYLALAEKPESRVYWALKFYEVLSNLYITMATPTLAQARRPSGQLSSCFIDTPDDSISGIFDGLTSFAKISQNGGGMGVYLGHVRALGSSIRDYAGVGSGVIPWVRLYNDTAVSVNQLGQRAGAVSIWLDIWHKDVIDFLDLKTNNGDERRKAHDVFPGLCVPDIFYETLSKGEKWYLMDPHEIRTKKGWALEDSWGDDFNKRYHECIQDGSISKVEINSLELMGLILKSLYESGGPFIMNRDTVNRLNPNKHTGMIYSSNLCTEITQNQSSTIRTSNTQVDGEIVSKFKVGDMVVCNLSSINLGRTNTPDLLSEVIPVQVRMLDNVITLNNLPVPQATVTNMKYRAIGIGVSGYHQLLVQNGIDWESEEHVKFADRLFEEINYHAIRASCDLAAERGAYPLFKGSDWETGDYFEMRNYNDWKWTKLASDVREKGIRNGYLMAIAPTGSTSVIAGSTATVDPIFKPVFTEEKKGFIIKRVAPDLNMDNIHLYKEAHSIDQEWSIKAAAARQRHLDQSQSLNLYATETMDETSFLNLYYNAWKLGVKTIYYFRNFTKEEEPVKEECESCQA